MPLQLGPNGKCNCTESSPSVDGVEGGHILAAWRGTRTLPPPSQGWCSSRASSHSQGATPPLPPLRPPTSAPPHRPPGIIEFQCVTAEAGYDVQTLKVFEPSERKIALDDNAEGPPPLPPVSSLTATLGGGGRELWSRVGVLVVFLSKNKN